MKKVMLVALLAAVAASPVFAVDSSQKVENRQERRDERQENRKERREDRQENRKERREKLKENYQNKNNPAEVDPAQGQ